MKALAKNEPKEQVSAPLDIWDTLVRHLGLRHVRSNLIFTTLIVCMPNSHDQGHDHLLLEFILRNHYLIKKTKMSPIDHYQPLDPTNHT